MSRKITTVPGIIAVLALVALTACSSVVQFKNPSDPALAANSNNTSSSSAAVAAVQAQQPATQTDQTQAATAAPAATQAAAPAAQPVQAQNGLLAAYETTLESIYTQVSPSVVSIHVVSQVAATNINPFGRGRNNGTPSTQVSEALGSGFVWDNQGDIVTNNHVVSGATSIDVTFNDGKNVPATVVGTDVYSDLAVIKVKVAASELHPVTMGDAKQIKVGELSIAIGNPYGLQNTMTVGVISGLGRSLPAGDSGSATTGPTYTIPDIIQTDTAINPGNSGGVLLNDQSQVLGVTAAIESASNANAGIGFVIPATIVNRVVPSLIKTGTYQHPYLGLSGTSLSADINSAMKLSADQQGALIESITAGGPADKAGLQSSNNTATINGQQTSVGGDVIIAINGQSIKSMDDLIAYLEDNTSVGQKVTLTILRNAKQTSVEVTLGLRPAQPTALLGIPGSDTSNTSLLAFPFSQGAAVTE
jgi:S1-C subfamily serine protease